jgi:hypothetical protein
MHHYFIVVLKTAWEHGTALGILIWCAITSNLDLNFIAFLLALHELKLPLTGLKKE